MLRLLIYTSFWFYWQCRDRQKRGQIRLCPVRRLIPA
jgi:hypothetical protein